MKKWWWVLLISISCESQDPLVGNVRQNEEANDPVVNCQPQGNGWSININQVLDAGIGKEGIPSIDQPQFTAASSVDYLLDNELVIAIKSGGDVKVYPHRIMDHHEVVNDYLANKPICVSLCPLTGTSLSWDRMIDGEEITFGVSGLLYESNLMPYDRETETYYSQMLYRGVKGDEVCNILSDVSQIEIEWSYIREHFPEAQVLNFNTGYNRNYQSPPISYQRNESGSPIFTTQFADPKIPSFRRVIGLFVGNNVFVSDLKGDENRTKLVGSKVNGNDVVMAYDRQKGYFAAFRSQNTGGQSLNISWSNLGGEAVFVDQNNNHYDAFGHSLNNSSDLLPIRNYAGYWYAFDIIFPNHRFVKDGEI